MPDLKATNKGNIALLWAMFDRMIVLTPHATTEDQRDAIYRVQHACASLAILLEDEENDNT